MLCRLFTFLTAMSDRPAVDYLAARPIPLYLQPMRTFSILLTVLLCGGCATQVACDDSNATEASIVRTGLTVVDFDGAAGYGRRIEFEGSALQVVATSDFAGEADKRIWGRTLTKAEHMFLLERVEQASRQALKRQYRDPDVSDGLQIRFELRPASGAAQSVSVANCFVEELAKLTDVLNVLLPVQYRVRYREWKDARDRADKEAADEGDSRT